MVSGHDHVVGVGGAGVSEPVRMTFVLISFLTLIAGCVFASRMGAHRKLGDAGWDRKLSLSPGNVLFMPRLLTDCGRRYRRYRRVRRAWRQRRQQCGNRWFGHAVSRDVHGKQRRVRPHAEQGRNVLARSRHLRR